MYYLRTTIWYHSNTYWIRSLGVKLIFRIYLINPLNWILAVFKTLSEASRHCKLQPDASGLWSWTPGRSWDRSRVFRGSRSRSRSSWRSVNNFWLTYFFIAGCLFSIFSFSMQLWVDWKKSHCKNMTNKIRLWYSLKFLWRHYNNSRFFRIFCRNFKTTVRANRSLSVSETCPNVV